MNILLSRTDSIGDVMLSLPMAGLIKQHWPEAKVVFLGRTYTRAVVECSQFVDDFYDWNAYEKRSENEQLQWLKSLKLDAFVHVFPNKKLARLAKAAQIPIRIGTAHRHFHWINCNRLPAFSRKKSDLHEAQLNLKLLQPLGINSELSLPQIAAYYGFQPKPLATNWLEILAPKGHNLILHTKSKGSAREWGLDNFSQLIDLALEKEFKIFLTGTEDEGKLFREKLLRNHPKVVDLSGKMQLNELVSFIATSDFLVAASTGPLHIAAASGIGALGIFPPIRPMHPGRWAPLGSRAQVLVGEDEHCKKCQNGEACQCMMQISPQQVLQALL